eukprot:TRINITY_DN13672_c0_g1_i2.p2 TRINITY_DN13672_c0_g1~~TRINITY_DN13672_c0_g1_i2.p2  ORF type:complete len:110 (-),score=6.28 TRINITY_DN13672_c0_g1_i2:214-543(-)
MLVRGFSGIRQAPDDLRTANRGVLRPPATGSLNKLIVPNTVEQCRKHKSQRPYLAVLGTLLQCHLLVVRFLYHWQRLCFDVMWDALLLEMCGSVVVSSSLSPPRPAHPS